MAYETPELHVIGSASTIVLGGLPNNPDDIGAQFNTTLPDLVCGLDQ